MAKRKREKQIVLYWPFLFLQRLESRLYCTGLFCLCRDWPVSLRSCCSVFCTVSIPSCSAVWSPPLIIGSHLNGERELWEAKCAVLSCAVFAETGQPHWELAALVFCTISVPSNLAAWLFPFIVGSHFDGKKELWEAKCITLSFSVFAETGQFHWELAALCSVLPLCPHTQLRGHSLVSAGSFPSCCDLLLVAALLQKLVQVGNNLLRAYSSMLCSTGCVYMYRSARTVCAHMCEYLCACVFAESFSVWTASP